MATTANNLKLKHINNLISFANNFKVQNASGTSKIQI